MMFFKTMAAGAAQRARSAVASVRALPGATIALAAAALAATGAVVYLAFAYKKARENGAVRSYAADLQTARRG